MSVLPYLVVFLFLTFSSAKPTSPESPVVDLGYARYKGAYNSTADVSHYLGIRFAAPPIGNLRWRAPQPPPTLRGIQHASAEPPQCPQAPMGAAATNTYPRPILRSDIPDTEDCLYLNVFMPGASVPKRKLPVLVWIHGGGYIFWNATMFNGEDLVQKSNGNLLIVSIQYRLGVLGFLSGNEVKANGVLNAGLLDQEYALKWVQTHISKFGGDPDEVTIWGASAGGGAVLQHAVARNGGYNPPLFKGAMASSMFLPPQYAYNGTIPEFIYDRVITSTGCKNRTGEHSMDCLRKVDLSQIQSINTELNDDGFFGTFTLVPVIDGEFITQRPTQALLQGKVNGQGLLATNVVNEGILVVNQSTASTVNITQFSGDTFPGLRPEHMTRIAQLYAALGSPLDQANLIMGESTYICPSYWFLRAYPGHGFRGMYAVPPALHGDDVPLSFPSFGTPVVQNTFFALTYSESFIRFILSLNPTRGLKSKYITPPWSEYTKTGSEMVFNLTSSGEPDIRSAQSDPGLLERCAYWESISEFTSQ
ncbi:hypothetical protein ONZ45_g12370 [Pleurotus djamor]|nr:hypothetical protein ONZ45_g12370 [Pleurotus djamor]